MSVAVATVPLHVAEVTECGLKGQEELQGERGGVAERVVRRRDVHFEDVLLGIVSEVTHLLDGVRAAQVDQFVGDQGLERIAAMSEVRLDALAQPTVGHGEPHHPIATLRSHFVPRVRTLRVASHHVGVRFHLAEVLGELGLLAKAKDVQRRGRGGVHGRNMVRRYDLGMDAPTWSIERMRQWLRADLESCGVPAAGYTADMVLSTALDVSRTELYIRPRDETLSPDVLAHVRSMVVRLRQREPVQYVLGRWAFRGLMLRVDPSTLIPRGATECVVEEALGALERRPEHEDTRVLDIGTGSGCILLAILHEWQARERRARGESLPWSKESTSANGARQPDPAIPTLDIEGRPVAAPTIVRDRTIRAVATDIVPEALALAKENAAQAGLSALVEFRQGSVWEPIPDGERFDLIVSNPPYIADAEWGALAPEVSRHEPSTALRGGADGLRFLRPIILGAPRRLRPEGTLIVEFGTDQATAVEELARQAGFSNASVVMDEDGLPRALVAR